MSIRITYNVYSRAGSFQASFTTYAEAAAYVTMNGGTYWLTIRKERA
jgi:dsDNA-binding SOS-regulon protein